MQFSRKQQFSMKSQFYGAFKGLHWLTACVQEVNSKFSKNFNSPLHGVFNGLLELLLLQDILSQIIIFKSQLYHICAVPYNNI